MLRRRKPKSTTEENVDDVTKEPLTAFDQPSTIPVRRAPLSLPSSHHRSLLSMGVLQRKRSISSPRDIGEVFFQAGMDFLSDVYDDSSDASSVIYDPPLSPAFPPKLPNLPNLESHIAGDGGNSASPTPTSTVVPDEPTSESDECDDEEVDGEEYSSWDVTLIVLFVIAAGSISSILFEFLVHVHSSATLLAALFLHMWIIVVSLPHAWEYTVHAKIPLHWHVLIVGLSFAFILFKSYALDKLSMPVFIACSNLQLVIGLCVGTTIFGKTFSRGQYLGVSAVTVGCALTAIPRNDDSYTSGSEGTPPSTLVADVVLGVGYMLVSLLAVSIMIPLGSMLVQKYEANIQEQIFLQHLLSMPLFALRYADLQPAITRIIRPSPYDVSIVGITIPATIGLLIGTTVFANINRYYTLELSLATNAIVSQLVNTGQKTLVLVVSMVYIYAPPFPEWYVWLGVVLQTLGSLYYMRDSFSDSTDSTFKPNTSRSRLARVHWDGTTNDLGLSASDMRHLRKLARVDKGGKLVRCVSDSLMPETLQRIVEEECDDSDDTDVARLRHSISVAKYLPIDINRIMELSDFLAGQESQSDLFAPPDYRSATHRSLSTHETNIECNDYASVASSSAGSPSRYRSVSHDDESIAVARARRWQVDKGN